MIPPLDVTGMLEPERHAFLDLLAALDDEEWNAPTECPAWTVKGVALHVLGDDLSLLSRQRDEATHGLDAVRGDASGSRLPPAARRLQRAVGRSGDVPQSGARHRVAAARGRVDRRRSTGRSISMRPGEPVGSSADRRSSPYWQAIAREYVERWVHQHQIRRALGRPDLGRVFLEPGGGGGGAEPCRPPARARRRARHRPRA